MLDVRRLGMLVALERLGTVAAVAEELRLTAPGISMQLSVLEREIGLPLTEKRGRRLALTPAGRLLASHGRDVLDRLSLAEREIHTLQQGAVGRYRVAAFPSAARTLVAEAWADLTATSGLELSVTTPEPEEALMALITGATDLAIVHSYSNVPRALPDTVQSSLIAVEPVWLAIREDDKRAAAQVDLIDFAGDPWITPTRELTCFKMIDRACGLAGFRPRIVAETTDFTVQLALVQAGSGVALIPDAAIVGPPPGVRLTRLVNHLERRTYAARRTNTASDAGLDRIVTVLRAVADHRTSHVRGDRQAPVLEPARDRHATTRTTTATAS